MARKFGGYPSLPRIFQRPSRLNVSEALVRLMEAAYRLMFSFWHFSCNLRHVDSASVGAEARLILGEVLLGNGRDEPV